MNDFYQLVKDSEVSSATILDRMRSQKAIVYSESLKPSLLCKMFHKKVFIFNELSHIKHYKCCNKCLKIWPHYTKMKIK